MYKYNSVKIFGASKLKLEYNYYIILLNFSVIGGFIFALWIILHNSTVSFKYELVVLFFRLFWQQPNYC